MFSRKPGSKEKKVANSMHGARVRIEGGKGVGVMWKRWMFEVISARRALKGA
jgi:hypothetical protein